MCQRGNAARVGTIGGGGRKCGARWMCGFDMRFSVGRMGKRCWENGACVYQRCGRAMAWHRLYGKGTSTVIFGLVQIKMMGRTCSMRQRRSMLARLVCMPGARSAELSVPQPASCLCRPQVPGCVGPLQPGSQHDAVARVQLLALHVLEARLGHRLLQRVEVVLQGKK